MTRCAFDPDPDRNPNPNPSPSPALAPIPTPGPAPTPTRRKATHHAQWSQPRLLPTHRARRQAGRRGGADAAALRDACRWLQAQRCSLTRMLTCLLTHPLTHSVLACFPLNAPFILPARGPCGRAGVWPHSTWCDAWAPPCTHLCVFAFHCLSPQARRARRGAARARAGLGLRAVRRRREAAAGVIWSEVCSNSTPFVVSQTYQLGRARHRRSSPTEKGNPK